MNTISTNFCKECAKLAELDSQYRSLISMISHEIRNPLTLIYSSLQLIEKECSAVTSSGLWPQTKKDIQDTISLLKDISALNRDCTSRRKPFPVAGFLSGIAESFRGLAQEKKIHFQTSFSSSLDGLSICGDEQLIKEALLNLLINAADAVVSTQGIINLTADYVGNSLELHIRDNGPGIPADYLATLFDPFVTHKKNGTGLGLSIARNAALQHGGILTVDTFTGHHSYTDFCLRLPLISSC